MKTSRMFVWLLATCCWLLATGFTSSPKCQVSSPKCQVSSLKSSNLQISKSSNLTYDLLWLQVDSLSNAGLPKSALEIVSQIYQKAITEQNDPQRIKSVIYRFKLKADFEENALVASIYEVQKEITTSTEPTRQIFYSILGQLYEMYFQQNRYRIQQRSTTLGSQSDSVPEWDLDRLVREIRTAYMNSLNNPNNLQSIPTKEFQEILKQGTQEMPPMRKEGDFSGNNSVIELTCTACRPTLYDFLAWRALDYFGQNQDLPSVSVESFKLDGAFFMYQAGPFVMAKMRIPLDTNSMESYAINILRSLAAFHLKDGDPSALIDEELYRFDFVREKGTFEQRDSLYLIALKHLENAHRKSPASSLITYRIAQFLSEPGTFNEALESPKYKWAMRDAVAYCDSAIQRFPESAGAKNCAILKAEITRMSVQLTTHKAIVPKAPALAFVEIKNISKLYFRLIKTEPEVVEDRIGLEDNDSKIKRYLTFQTLTTWSQEIPNDGDYLQHRLELKIPALSEGFYLLLTSSGEAFDLQKDVITCNAFFSTRISYVSSIVSDGGNDFYILDRETGNPLKKAAIEAFSTTYDYVSQLFKSEKVGDFTTDENGYFSIPKSTSGKNNNSVYLKIRVGKELFITRDYYFAPYRQPSVKDKASQRTYYFTDRAIYRPGQPIYFKGILTEQLAGKSTLIPNTSTTIALYDVNQKKVAEKSFVTNEFGSFNGSFIAPTGVLLGTMRIGNNSGYTYIQVEEYKRPTFEVTFTPVTGNFMLNEKVEVSGKAESYAGNPLGGATLTYRVVRNGHYPFRDFSWLPLHFSPEVEITQGSMATHPDGSFTIPFTAGADATMKREDKPVFTFTVFVSVTDINGETQMAQVDLNVGYQSLILQTNLEDKINLQHDSPFKLSTTNLNGEKTPAVVHVRLLKLKSPEHPLQDRDWATPDLVVMSKEQFQKEFPNQIYHDEDNPTNWGIEEIIHEWDVNTANDSLIQWSTLGSRFKVGSYALHLTTKDPFGNAVETKEYFTAFDPTSNLLPLATYNWFVPLKTKVEPGEDAQFLIGSSEKDVKIIYEIRRKDSLPTRQWIEVDNKQKLITVPVLESDRGNFEVNFIFIKHNRTYQNQALVVVPYTNKKLDITFKSFRDRLTPGEKERWNIRISDFKNRGVKAEFLASMYDASLDVFSKQDWSFPIWNERSLSNYWDVTSGFNIDGAITSSYPLMATLEPVFRTYQELDWFGMNIGFGGRGGERYAAPMLMVAENSSDSKMSGAPPPPPPSSASDMGKSKSATPHDVQGTPPQSIRRDFRETAFFYPTIVTDTAGNLELSFTVPESLTKWKLRGLAYTTDLQIGQLEKELITQKELMVFPNYPRFIRQGDTVIYSVKVVNMSDRTLSGKVEFTAPPLQVENASLPFTISANEATSVSWKLFVALDPTLSVVSFKTLAAAGSFSDGEEKMIPVLPNRMLVTETLPLPVKGAGKFDFTLSKLVKSNESTSLNNYKLTLEFASNPAWYAIQALPVLDEPNYPSADHLFYAYYANSISSFIANSNPEIKRVFESWKNISPDALRSNLEKNEALKSVLLQETPWVMEASTESEQKQRLGLLFDLNTLSQQMNQNFEKLRKLQSPNGGWYWFAGMPENRYMTQNIVTGLGRLQHLGITAIHDSRDMWKMTQQAIDYLDRQLIADYLSIKKNYQKTLDENHLDYIQIQYLYARSYFMKSQKPEAKSLEAISYYQKQAEKYWLKQDIYNQGMLALALYRLGNKVVAQNILKSLKEKALHSPELGMYWAQNAGFYWYQAPIETQALLIEAFEEINNDATAVEEMKVWLLKQKQTQGWKTNRATADACFALLLRGSDLLTPSSKVEITLGKDQVLPGNEPDSKGEAGTGYFQSSISGKEIQPEMGKVTVQKANPGVAWGALYWQYFEDLDKITKANSPLKIEKKLFIETNTDNGPVLYEITKDHGRRTDSTRKVISSPTHQLKIGDKLKVRLTLTVDRNLEYIHLKDLRASACEPITTQAISGYRYQDGLGYYQTISDASTSFFFDYLPKGTWVFEYPLVVNAAGDYSMGIATVQCLYAPEFAAHSDGWRIHVVK